MPLPALPGQRRDMVSGTLECYCKKDHFHVSNYTAVGFVMVTCVAFFHRLCGLGEIGTLGLKCCYL